MRLHSSRTRFRFARFAAGIATLSFHLLSSYGQSPAEPELISAIEVKYPNLARAARVRGVVQLEFGIAESGETRSVKVLSGPPLLAGAAKQTVESWRFKPAANGNGKFRTTFSYVFSGLLNPWRDGEVPTIVESHSFGSVRVLTPQLGDRHATGCPADEVVRPPPEKGPNDFVELSRLGCYGACPVYSIRIYRNGDTTWIGQRWVETMGEVRGHAEPLRAVEILDLAQTEKFWSLCGYYDREESDNPTDTVMVMIGGQKKSVSDYGTSAPRWFHDLTLSIDAVAGTRQWRGR